MFNDIKSKQEVPDLPFHMEQLKIRQNIWKNGFQTLDIRWYKAVILERGQTNEVNSDCSSILPTESLQATLQK